MSKINDYLLEQQEQKGVDLVKPIDYYGDGEPYDSIKVQKDLDNDPEWQKFLDELENCF